MQNFSPLSAALGGLLIGLSATLMLVLHGRVTGISGIVGQAIGRDTERSERRTHLWFLAGLIVGAWPLARLLPSHFEVGIERSTLALAIAGLLVGFGTRLGSGCTSGHGVCGLSRFSLRSLVATALFIGSGAASVFLVQHLLGGTV